MPTLNHHNNVQNWHKRMETLWVLLPLIHGTPKINASVVLLPNIPQCDKTKKIPTYMDDCVLFLRKKNLAFL